MGIYRRFVLPRLIDHTMKDEAAALRRSRIVPQATGLVLEVGIGSGHNFPFYSNAVTRLHGVDPSVPLLTMAQKRITQASCPVTLRAESAERLSLDTDSVDTVVMTWSLCSISDPRAALGEIKRVLKPGGRLLFVEHGLSSDPGVRAWQNRLNPLWKPLGGGCNLNRKIDDMITSAGFEIAELRTDYDPGPRVTGYTFEGVGVARG